MNEFRDLTKLHNMLEAARLLRKSHMRTSFHEWMSSGQMDYARKTLGPLGVPTSDAPGEMHGLPLATGGAGDYWLSVVCGATTRSDAETVEIAFLRLRLFGGWDMCLNKGRPGWDESGEVRGFCTFADVLDETAAFVARKMAGAYAEEREP